MNPKKTTKSEKRGEKGNCLAAAFASILDLEISDIPQFEDMQKDTWKCALNKWASSIGINIEFTHSMPTGFSIGIGIHKCGEHHAVVLRDGLFYFDTNGTGKYYEEHRYCISVTKINT
jgi:hypothetical protein